MVNSHKSSRTTIFGVILVDSWGLFGVANFLAESLAVCQIPKDI